MKNKFCSIIQVLIFSLSMSGISAHGADENHLSDDSFAQNAIEVIQINQDEAHIGREGDPDFLKNLANEESASPSAFIVKDDKDYLKGTFEGVHILIPVKGPSKKIKTEPRNCQFRRHRYEEARVTSLCFISTYGNKESYGQRHGAFPYAVMQIPAKKMRPPSHGTESTESAP